MQIANYFASIGFKIDPKEVRKVDKHLKLIENKLKMFAKKNSALFKIDIAGFDINQAKLRVKVQASLDNVARTTAMPITNFAIDQARLNRQMITAMTTASRVASKASQLSPDVNGVGGRGVSGRHLVAAGGLGGLAARAYTPLIGLGLGGYGLAQMNKRNQEVISAQLTTQAVTEAAGLKGQGTSAFEWLRSQGNRIGFNYLDNAQDYNNFLSNSLGAGQTMEQSQDIYLGFSEYQRAMGITPARQKLVMNALSQMQGKGAISMEELRRQMAESMPGTMSIFAQAYQQMTGGNAEGQAAIAALMEAVPTGKVKSSEILPLVAQIMRTRAAPKLDVAMKTSQAEQARFQNIVSDTSILASKSGVESGFARLFRALKDGLKEAAPMVESMARGFDNMSKYVSSAVLGVQSIQRLFQGRDSLIGDKLFPNEEERQKAFQFIASMKTFMGEMNTLLDTSYEGWKKIIGLIDGSAGLSRITNTMNALANGVGAVNSAISGDMGAAKEKAKAFGMNYLENITAIPRAIPNMVLREGSQFLARHDPRISDPSSVPYPQIGFGAKPFNPAEFESNKRAQQKVAAANRSRNNYNGPVGIFPIGEGEAVRAGVGGVQVNVDVKIDAATVEDFNEKFQMNMQNILDTTILQYSRKE